MMDWKAMIAVYFLFWAFSVFLVLPFFGRKAHEVPTERVPGEMDGAPLSFPTAKIGLRVTIVATILFVLFQVNYSYGWIGADDLNWLDRLLD